MYVASVLELARTPGMTEARAVRIQAALELGRRMMAAPREPRYRVNTPGDAVELLMPDMMLLEQEHMRLILLNSRHEVISTPTIYKGSLNTAVVRVAEVFKDALRQNAAALVVSHNHPSGDPSPSPEDIRVTRSFVEAGKLLGVEVIDHVIIGHNRYVSLKERGLGPAPRRQRAQAGKVEAAPPAGAGPVWRAVAPRRQIRSTRATTLTWVRQHAPTGRRGPPPASHRPALR